MKLQPENKPMCQTDGFYISFGVGQTKQHDTALTTSLHWYIYNLLLTFL